MKRNVTIAATLALVMLLIPLRGFAQAGSEEWRYSVTPYLWLPSLNGTLRYGPPPPSGASPNISVSSEDILNALDMAFMITADARKGRWSIATDYIYLSLSGGQSGVKSIDFNPGPGPINITTTALNLGAQVDIKGSIWSLFGGYALVQEPHATLDLIGGFRYLDLKTTTNWQLSATVTGPAGTTPFARTGSVTQSVGLWDAIVGVRGRFKVGDGNWFVPYHFDVGGGDSKLTWQGVAGIAYSYKWGDVGLVYR